MKRLAFIGLGVMGAPMARHLARAGYEVIGYNRTRERAKVWRDSLRSDGIEVELADTPADAVREAEIVLTCVGNDNDLGTILLQPGNALAAMRAGTLIVDHTTVSPQMARRIASAATDCGVLVLDTPVSGGQAGAENGRLSIMCGGSEAAMRAAKPIMQAYAARIVHIGPAGAGQACKAVNQICIAGLLAGLAEGLRFAEGADLDLDKVFEAISGGAAQSWQMDNRWATMAKGEFDFGFAIDWMRKDLAIALAEAEAQGQELPVTRLVDGYYAKVQSQGGARFDTSALVKHLPEIAR